MQRKKQTANSPIPLRERAEAAVRPRPLNLEEMSAEHVRELAHQLDVHRIELEMQNEELRAAQRLLEESRDRYVELYEFAPAGYLTLDSEGVVRECNLTAAAALGVDRSKAVNRPLSRFVAPDYQEIYFRFWRQIVPEPQLKSCELRLNRRDHESFYVELRAEAERDSANVLTGHRVILVDITERRAAEQRYRDFVDHATDAFFLHGPLGKVLDVNSQACASLGYERQELIGKLPADFDPDVTAEGGRQIEARLLAGEIVSFDSRHRRKDGSVFPVEVRIRPFWSNGQMFGMALARDISERTQAERKVRESEERLRAWMEASAQIYWTVGADGKAHEDSPSWREFTGQQYDEFHGDGWLKAIHPDDRQRTEGLWTAAQKTQAPVNFEYRLWHAPTEQWRWVNDRAVCIRHGDGSTRAWVGMCIDIHERKLAEEGLASSRDRYAELYDFAPVGYMTLDSQGVLRECNLTAAAALGLERNQALDRLLSSFVAAEDREVFERHWMLISPGQYTGACELRLKRPHGEPLYVELRSAAVLDGAGGVCGYRVVLIDVSERKLLERQRDELREQLHQSQRLEAVGIVAAGVAHDFNNTLAAMMGSAELMQDDLGDRAAMTGHIQTIRTAAESANLLVSRLLHFTKERAPAKRPTSLNTLLENQRIVYERLLGKDIKLGMKLDRRAPLVLADPSELVQLVLNLIVNAKDAIAGRGRGRVQVTTACSQPGPERPERWRTVTRLLKLVVADNGAGMSAETMQKAFQPFFSTKQPGRSCGLGLSVVSGIVQAMNGSIAVHSAPSKGTSFEILVPSCGLADQTGSRRKHRLPARRRDTILVVDDNELVRSTISQLLAGQGYAIVEADSGRRALECVHNGKRAPSLLLTDVMMAEMDGPQLAKLVRQEFPSMPILFMTGNGANALHEAGLGGCPVLDKPLVRADLVAAVQEALQASQVPAARFPSRPAAGSAGPS